MSTRSTHLAPKTVIDDLERQLREAGEDSARVVSIAPYGDGHSGVTYAVELSGDGPPHRAVLRLSPEGVRLAGPADVGRQGRIIAAVGAGGAPAPRVIACSSEPVVDGRAFALTEFVDGVTWEVAARERSHRHVAERAVEVMRRIQALEPTQTGLEDEQAVGPAEEVETWAKLISRAPADIQGSAGLLLDLLRASPPGATAPVLVHGDYHYGNLIFSNGQIVAVVDWEIAQRGEPLLDLGSLAVASLRRRYLYEPNPTGAVEVSLGDLIEIYGADPQAAGWFFALSCFKYGAILAYNLALYRKGKTSDPVYEQLQGTSHGLMADGALLLQEGVEALDAGGKSA